MQNTWILLRVKYFLSVEAILCQFPNLWFLQLTPRSDLALTARIPQQIRQILKGFSVQWETRQGPPLVLVWQVPRQACTQALRDGGGHAGHTPRLEGSGKGCLWKPCLEWISEDEQEWAHGKGEKQSFGQKRDIMKKGAWHTGGAAPCHIRVGSRIAKELKH